MSLARQVLSSSALLVAIKFIHRLLGLVSTLILARLLTPADFGLVALVSITVYFFDVLSSAGSDQYIIRKETVSQADLDTAWTLDLLMKSILWVALFALAPAVSVFFQQPDLTTALRVGALVLPLNALASARLNLLKQQFEYSGIFWLSLAQRLVAFAVVIALAWHIRSYWAMIAGDIVASTFFSAGSYLVAPQRPKLTLVHLTQQWRFSGWMLLKSVIGYTRAQIDTLFISKLFPGSILGHYHVTRDIAMLPAHNLVLPASEPLLAMFRQSREDPPTMARQLRLALLVTGIAIIPITVFTYLFCDLLILLLLGNQWTASAPLLRVFTLLLLYFSFQVVAERALVALNKVRLLFVLDVLGFILIAMLLTTVINRTAEDIGLMRGLAGIINLTIMLAVTSRLFERQSTVPLSGLLCVTTIAGLAGWATVRAFPPSTGSSWQDLLMASATFGIAYMIGCVAYVWTMARQFGDPILKDILSLVTRALTAKSASKTETL